MPRTRTVLFAVALVALVARGWAFFAAQSSPSFDVPLVDSRSYDLAARALLENGRFDARFFWQPFFYPTFLAVVYGLSGASIVAVKVVQLLLGVQVSVLTAWVGTRRLGTAAGLGAGLIVALHGPTIFFEGELLATTWAAFWAVVLVERAMSLHDAPGLRAWALFGLLGALAVLTRPTFAPFLLVFAIFEIVAAARRGAWLATLQHAFVAAAVFALVVVPIGLLGATATGEFRLLPASGSMNLYLGNSPAPCETVNVRPGQAWQDLFDEDDAARAGDLGTSERRFREMFWRSVRENPGTVARNLGRKGLQLVSAREIPRNLDPYLQREWSPALRVLMGKAGNWAWPMGLWIPLALLGFWRGRKWLGPVPLLFVLTYGGAIVLVFVSARYRIPLVPVVALAAAAGGRALLEAWRAGGPIGVRVPIAVLAGGLLLVTLPGPFCEEEIDYRGEYFYAVGYHHHESGDLVAAERAYLRALETRPEDPELLNQMGLLRGRQGRPAEAQRQFERALQADPGQRLARLNLANLLLADHRHAEALAHFQVVLRSHPEDLDALIGAGYCELGLARFESGVELLVRAVELDPRRGASLERVVQALVAQGHDTLAARLESALLEGSRRRVARPTQGNSN